jgi:hypothetical protein
MNTLPDEILCCIAFSVTQKGKTQTDETNAADASVLSRLNHAFHNAVKQLHLTLKIRTIGLLTRVAHSPPTMFEDICIFVKSRGMLMASECLQHRLSTSSRHAHVTLRRIQL